MNKVLHKETVTLRMLKIAYLWFGLLEPTAKDDIRPELEKYLADLRAYLVFTGQLDKNELN